FSKSSKKKNKKHKPQHNRVYNTPFPTHLDKSAQSQIPNRHLVTTKILYTHFMLARALKVKYPS
ncbi:MAG: hypothetical protein AAGJ35_06890, partial [Myxococcota bacterium]